MQCSAHAGKYFNGLLAGRLQSQIQVFSPCVSITHRATYRGGAALGSCRARQDSGWVAEAPVIQITIIGHHSLASSQSSESSSGAQLILFLPKSLRKRLLCVLSSPAPPSPSTSQSRWAATVLGVRSTWPPGFFLQVAVSDCWLHPLSGQPSAFD